MISKRLLAISKLVEKNKVVFDVGSDHGKLPIFLVKEGICYKAYAGDNKQGPLNNAIENIKSNNLQDNIIPILSDGVPNYIDDIDVVIIAGMGYRTIEHILDNLDICKYEYLIIQSNSDVDLLRKYISDHNYTIINEEIIFDGFYYQIIQFNREYHEKYNDMQIKYGPILLNRMDDIFIQYLNYKNGKLKEISISANSQEINKTIEEIDSILNISRRIL